MFSIPLWYFSTEKRYFIINLIENDYDSVFVLGCIVRITLYERAFLFSINLMPVDLLNPVYRNNIDQIWNLKSCLWQRLGYASGISLQYSCIKCRTQNIWSKEELCDMAGLLFHSKANERRPRCHFCGWSNDSKEILSSTGSLYLWTHWLTDRVTCAAYRIYQLIVGQTRPCYTHLVVVSFIHFSQHQHAMYLHALWL